jgi:uncharacterized protein YjgD (DUF1641 family)
VAQPIPLEVPPRDPRKELSEKLANAPAGHAEILLSVYELLEQLSDQHVFENLRSALGAGEKFIESAGSKADAPASIRALRNAIILGRTLSAIDPDVLQSVGIAARETFGMEKNSDTAESPGFLSLFNQLRQTEIRRTVGLISRFLDVYGREMKSRQSRANQ